ncbi:MAG: response regulator [Gemmatimonadaceae bacterium]|nr:response regulator [Gemmatimonadaceae bacterium]
MILIIEDDQITTHILTALMKRQRWEHVIAGTCVDAQQVMASVPLDLVLTDVSLRDGNGLDLVEQMMLKPWLQDIPVMLCTADGRRATVERALGLGAVDYIKKPLNVDQMQSRIVRALQRAPRRWENWREMIKRLRVDGRSFFPLLQLTREQLVRLVEKLERWNPATGDVDEVNADVARLRSAALNVGAVRCVSMIDFLWTGSASEQDVADLHDAMAIEARSFEKAISNRNAGLATLGGGAR